MIALKCPVCGKPFEGRNKTQVFCSKKCRWHAHDLARRQAKSKMHDVVCVFCGKEFKTYMPNAKFCSRLCQSRRNQGHENLAEFEQAQKNRREAASRAAVERRAEKRSAETGLTFALMREVERAQDGDPSQLWRLSQSWTKAQRKYAKERYEKRHGLFACTFNP